MVTLDDGLKDSGSQSTIICESRSTGPRYVLIPIKMTSDEAQEIFDCFVKLRSVMLHRVQEQEQ